jgi:putative flippase GtrA
MWKWHDIEWRYFFLMIALDKVEILQRDGVRQFMKFCIVGASSFIIDVGVSYLLTFEIFHLWWVIARTISFSLAVTNGFFWNQRWTFRAVGRRKNHEQYMMFFGVNIIGWLLNLSMMKGVFFLTTHRWEGQHPARPVWFCAILFATVVVTFWNYFANKHWTFQHRSSSNDIVK